MKITIKDCDSELLLEIEMVSFRMGDNATCQAVVPYMFPNADMITSHDLYVIRVETTAINTEGHARIYEVLPDPQGSLLKIKYDTSTDVQ